MKDFGLRFEAKATLGTGTDHARHQAGIVSYGVDTEKFRPGKDITLRKELGINSDSMVISTIGQIKADKGIFDFVASARLVLRWNPN